MQLLELSVPETIGLTGSELGTMVFECTKCNSGFSRRWKLGEHEKKKHSGNDINSSEEYKSEDDDSDIDAAVREADRVANQVSGLGDLQESDVLDTPGCNFEVDRKDSGPRGCRDAQPSGKTEQQVQETQQVSANQSAAQATDNVVSEGAVSSAPVTESNPWEDHQAPFRLQRLSFLPPKWERHEDRRLAFLGAPSQYSMEHPSCFLRRIRREARRQQPFIRYTTREASLVVREERAFLPDGTVYSLKTAWLADPLTPLTHDVATETIRQFEIGVGRGPEK